MNYDFDILIDRKNTNSHKWDNNKKYFGREDILPFWIADTDFPCAEPIVAALQKRISHPVYGYTTRSESYIQAICGWLKKRHSWEVNAEWLCFCPPGVMPAISMGGNRGDGRDTPDEYANLEPELHGIKANFLIAYVLTNGRIK